MKNISFLIGLIGLLALLVGCKPKTEEIEPLVNIRVKGSEIVLVDSKTGESLKVTPCVAEAEATGREKPPPCAIFDSEVKTLQIARVDSTFSEKRASSVTCVTTFVADGRSYQLTYDFPRKNGCPKDWFRV